MSGKRRVPCSCLRSECNQVQAVMEHGNTGWDVGHRRGNYCQSSHYSRLMIAHEWCEPRSLENWYAILCEIVALDFLRIEGAT